MSFVQSHADPAARAKAIIVVTGIHAVLGITLVVGLTYTGVINVTKNLPSRLFPTAPPPETPAPPPEAAQPTTPQIPQYAPVPQIPLTPTAETTVRPVPENPPVGPIGLAPIPLPTPTYSPAVPTPTPSFSPVSARPRNGPTGWITNNDYPRAGITRQLEGVAGYRLVIGSDGRVDECQITSGTGHTVLDRATCQLIERRAQFEPAKDQSGRTVVGTYTGQVTWDIPD